MKKISSVIFLLLLSSSWLFSQTIRTDVLVVGGTLSAVSAGIQASRSGVKTLLVSETNALNPTFTANDIGYFERVQNHYALKSKKKPSLISANITQPQFSQLVKSITDTVKNLTVMLNSGIQEIEKERNGWEIRLKNGQKIKTDVVVDATENSSVAALLKIQGGKTIISMNADVTNLYSNKSYRTSVAVGEFNVVPLGAFLPVGFENLISVPRLADINPVSAGQAAGASAAYCTFFKTTTKDLNVRVIQGELLAFDSKLMPFTDIRFTDTHFMPLQRIGVTGLLKAKIEKKADSTTIAFDTAGTVSSEDLLLPMKEYYSRSQIWFKDHEKDTLTIEDAINLIMYTATRGEELRREIENGWKESFKFSTVYDPKRLITRREFAVLADAYLQPFNVRVDLNGNLLS